MVSDVEHQCKKQSLVRCIRATVLSCASQMFLMNIFVFLLNIQLFHPVRWLMDTFGILFSFHTWLTCVPLLAFTCLYGFLLGKTLCKVQVYHSTRFHYIVSTALSKGLILLSLLLIGFFTTWLYTGLLDEDYKNLTYKCGKGNCINTLNSFIMLAGLYASMVHFVKEHLRREPVLSYEIVPQSRYNKIRTVLQTTLLNTLSNAIIPTICFLVLHWFLSENINARLARFLNVQIDSDAVSDKSGNVKKLLYAMVSITQILSCMQSMQQIFNIFLTHEREFPIQKRPSFAGLASEITLVEVLNISNVPNMQALASLDLLELATSGNSCRRLQIYELSQPGGHPYNWNQLSGQCLSMINAFTEDLKESINNISTLKKPSLFPPILPQETDTAAKILLRHYNDMNGLRRLTPAMTCDSYEDEKPSTEPGKTVAVISRYAQNMSKDLRLKLEIVRHQLFCIMPGLCYFFGEQDGGKVLHLLSNSQTVAWVVQALASISVASLKEDKYGVVQAKLPEIIKSLLYLALELDKLSNVHLKGSKHDTNVSCLSYAVTRSLNNICKHFRSYMCDLITEPEDLSNLQEFINYIA